jgi:hypothetical protein
MSLVNFNRSKNDFSREPSKEQQDHYICPIKSYMQVPSYQLRSYSEALQDSFFKVSSFQFRKEYSFDKILVPSSSVKKVFASPARRSREKISQFEADHVGGSIVKSRPGPKVNGNYQEFLGKRLGAVEKQNSSQILHQPLKKLKAQNGDQTDNYPQTLIQCENQDEFYSDSDEQARATFYLSSQDLQNDIKILENLRFGPEDLSKLHSSSENEVSFNLKWLGGKSKDDHSLCNNALKTHGEVLNLKAVLDYHQNEQVLFSKRLTKTYLCKYCGASFKTGCALGGHISKIHRGVNLQYSRKMQHRRDHKIERDRHRFVKDVLQKAVIN